MQLVRRTPVKPNHSVPPATVVPILIYPDVRAAVTWLGAAFGFRERERIGESHRAQLSVGADGAVIVAEAHGEEVPPESRRATHLIRVRMDDVEVHHSRARELGALVLDGPIDREYGERDYTVEDLIGHRWNSPRLSEMLHLKTSDAKPSRPGRTQRDRRQLNTVRFVRNDELATIRQ
jgi:uncharacterized glyoxalase superfamily protein PhnB